MTEQAPSGETERPNWAAPVPLGSRLAWFYGDRNWSIPVISVESIYTDERRHDLENGWDATLPTENGVEIDVMYDPQPEYPVDERVAMFIYVRHPEFGQKISARIDRGEFSDGVRYWVAYDPSCGGENCEGPCSCRDNPDSVWMEYMRSPQQVLDRLAWIGSLPIRLPDVSQSGSTVPSPSPQGGE